MKVLFINSVYGSGSTGRIVMDLAEMVKSHGGEYRIICGRTKINRNSDPNVVNFSKQFDVFFHAFMGRLFDSSGFHSKKATRRIIKFIDDYSPDIINLHNLHGYYINIKILFDYLKHSFKGKVIWTLHDCWSFTGHCAHYSFVHCQKWQTGCYSCPQKHRYPKSILFDASRRNYIKKKKCFSGINNLIIVTPSKWLMGEVKKSFLANYSCFVINNGIDLKIFHPISDTNREFNLLNVTDGFDERKGFNDLLKLMDLLPNEYKLKIVGVNEPNEGKFGNRISVIKKTNSIDELVHYYSNSCFLVNPTYEDTFPTINIEALACGTPVITYESGGSHEIIDEKCGVSIPAGDIKKMALAIVQRHFCENDCVNRAQSFNKTINYNKYYELFLKLMDIL